MIRLVVLDDNPFARHPDGSVRSLSATFHAFVSTVVAEGPFERADYLIPVADAAETPSLDALPAVDADHLRVVATAPFTGIAGYLRSAHLMVGRNWPIIRSTVAAADLVWIKAPASNAALAGIAARRAGTPSFTWVAGSVREVVQGQVRPIAARGAALAVATVYDSVTRWLERSGPSIRLDEVLFSSILTGDEVAASAAAASARPTRASTNSPALVWAGRLAPEKGLDDLLHAIARLRSDRVDARLVLLGDGPERARLEAMAATLGLNGAVRFRGHIADRAEYLDALRAADIFVLPSRAEGLPKVAVEAMGAGVPVIATRVGAVPALLDRGERGVVVQPGNPARLADSIAGLVADAATRDRLRWAGLAFAADHTSTAQARRLIEWMRSTFPALPWDGRKT